MSKPNNISSVFYESITLTAGATAKSVAEYINGAAGLMAVRDVNISAPSTNTTTLAIGDSTTQPDNLTAGGAPWTATEQPAVFIDLDSIFVADPSAAITNKLTIRYLL